MNSNLDCRFRHAGQLRRFHNRKPLDLDVQDGQTLTFWQEVQNFFYIPTSLRRFGIGRGKYFDFFVQRVVQRFPASPAAQEVDELVFCYRMNPCELPPKFRLPREQVG